MTLLGKYAPETIIELISSSHFLRILCIASHKKLEILIFCFVNFWSCIMLTVLFVCWWVLAEAREDAALFLVRESSLCLTFLVTEILPSYRTVQWQLCGQSVSPGIARQS